MSAVNIVPLLLALALIATSGEASEPDCLDQNADCREWVLADPSQCTDSGYVKRSCLRSCGVCISPRHKRRFDAGPLAPELSSLQWLIGIWRNENGGKARFPTIPNFTFGEQLEFWPAQGNPPSINFTSFAWSMDRSENRLPEELHSESGFITMKGGQVALTTVMNNGFVTVEQGQLSGQGIRFHLVDIGRINFSRDLPVNDLVREWTLVDSRTLESRFSMGTLTHGVREHTHIVLKKIF